MCILFRNNASELCVLRTLYTQSICTSILWYSNRNVYIIQYVHNISCIFWAIALTAYRSISLIKKNI